MGYSFTCFRDFWIDSGMSLALTAGGGLHVLHAFADCMIRYFPTTPQGLIELIGKLNYLALWFTYLTFNRFNRSHFLWFALTGDRKETISVIHMTQSVLFKHLHIVPGFLIGAVMLFYGITSHSNLKSIQLFVICSNIQIL